MQRRWLLSLTQVVPVGYADDPPCGSVGAFRTCNFSALICNGAAKVNPPQGCR